MIRYLRPSTRDARSWALWGISVAFLTRGAAYLTTFPGVLPIGLREASAWVPLWLYGAMWLAGGALVAVVAVGQWPPRWWHTAALFTPMFWGACYLASGLTDEAVPTNPNWIENAIFFWSLAWITAAVLASPPRPAADRCRRGAR